jgi:hypothetical protein
VEDIMTHGPDPVTLKRLERAVRKLPRLQREIFLALRLDDLSYDEIAERTGLTAGMTGIGRKAVASCAISGQKIAHTVVRKVVGRSC